jgi:transmembrane sensor
VDENQAWDQLTQKLDTSKKSTFNWLKIAASVVIVLSVSIALYISNAPIKELEVATTDERINVTFPDGSLGVLNEYSSFSFPEEFGDDRRVSFSGEAYFDIIKSNKPFIIDANGVEVKVLGTAFNLITDENNVSLYVDRGLVAFSKDGVDTKVKAGLEAIFNKKTNKVTIKEIPNANIMSWRNGYFKFDDTPLNEALADLSEYYDVEFKLTNNKLSSCRISVVINQKSLSEAVDLIESILAVKAEIKNHTVKISGKGC